MKSMFVFALFSVILVVVTSLSKPCVYDEFDCVGLECPNNQKGFCHKNECHCHRPVGEECVYPDHKKCEDMCGQGSLCDENGHCHGPNCHVE